MGLQEEGGVKMCGKGRMVLFIGNGGDVAAVRVVRWGGRTRGLAIEVMPVWAWIVRTKVLYLHV